MSQNERITNGPSNKNDAKSATPPMRNSPTGGGDTKRGSDNKSGQLDVAGQDKDAATANPRKEGSAGRGSTDKSRNGGNKR